MRKGDKIPLPRMVHRCYIVLVDSELPPTVHHRVKRKRGGQKGNQNARKHGFYSGSLDPGEVCQFWNIVNMKSVDPEIAALSIKTRSLLDVAPGNRRALREAAKLLVKWYSAKYKLDNTDTGHLRKVIIAIMESAANLAPPFSGSPGGTDI